ncbi:MAG: hypothetical protein LBR79_04575 [Oscillospiraceae bacterium]|jgi:hypothetical protein|nr:hypothetical protein [Oscillospiraceae bacterium]
MNKIKKILAIFISSALLIYDCNLIHARKIVPQNTNTTSTTTAATDAAATSSEGTKNAVRIAINVILFILDLTLNVWTPYHHYSPMYIEKTPVPSLLDNPALTTALTVTSSEGTGESVSTANKKLIYNHYKDSVRKIVYYCDFFKTLFFAFIFFRGAKHVVGDTEPIQTITNLMHGVGAGIVRV